MENNHQYSAVPRSENEKKIIDQMELEDYVPPPNGSRTFLFIAAYTVNLATFSCGIALGWTSPVIPKLQTLDESPLSEVISLSEEGWIGSLLPLGAVFGPFVACLLSDRIGRKNTLLIGNLPFVCGFLLNVLATNVYDFLISRFLCGLATGLTFTVLPMYVGEIAEDKNRGTLGCMLQLFATIGLLFSYVIGPYTSVKLFNILCLTIPMSFLVLYYSFIPESPYYLLQAGKEDEAEKALMKLRSTNDKKHVFLELRGMKASVANTLANKGSFLDIFKSKGLKKAYILSNALLIFQQFSGINIVLFFAQSIFKDAGVALAPAICTIIIGIVQVISSGVSSVLIEKQGKRVLLMISAIFMALSQAALGFFFYLKDDKHSDVSALSWLPIACLITYIITYCLGFGPVPWAVMGEMFPANVKSIASTFTSATCWFCGFLLTKYFVSVADLIGKSGSFALFAGCCAVGFGFVFKFVPETSGKSLQEIQDILDGKPERKL